MKNEYFSKRFILIMVLITSLPGIGIVTSRTVQQTHIAQGSDYEFWYSFNTYQNPAGNPTWIPFYSLTDVPESIPMRGFISNTHSAFVDLGAFEWFSNWSGNVWGNTINSCESRFYQLSTITDQSNCLQYGNAG